MGDRPGPEHGDRRHVHGRTDRLEPSRLGSGHGDSRQVPKHPTSTCDIFGVVEKGHADSWFLPSAARDADVIPEATDLHINLVPMAHRRQERPRAAVVSKRGHRAAHKPSPHGDSRQGRPRAAVVSKRGHRTTHRPDRSDPGL